MNWQRLKTFHKTSFGFAVFGFVELAVAYSAASWAVDSGSLLLYVVALIFLVGALQNFVKLLRGTTHGDKAR